MRRSAERAQEGAIGRAKDGDAIVRIVADKKLVERHVQREALCVWFWVFGGAVKRSGRMRRVDGISVQNRMRDHKKGTQKTLKARDNEH